MLKKVIYKLCCALEIHRLQDIFGWLMLESRRRHYEARSGLSLNFVRQGAGSVEIYGDLSRFKIGATSHLKTGTFIECSGGVSIGEYFHTGRGLTIFSTKHIWKGADYVPYGKLSEDGPVMIGNAVWFGANVTILPGTIIGDGVIVGAGSVVRGTVPTGSIVIGNPAVVVGSRDMAEFERLYRSGACF